MCNGFQVGTEGEEGEGEEEIMPFRWVDGLKVCTSGLMGDKRKMGPENLECPWKGDCPSHVLAPGIPRVERLKQKVVLVERIQPYIYKYRCKHCGMCWVQDMSGEGQKRGFEKQPALLGGALRI